MLWLINFVNPALSLTNHAHHILETGDEFTFSKWIMLEFRSRTLTVHDNKFKHPAYMVEIRERLFSFWFLRLCCPQFGKLDPIWGQSGCGDGGFSNARSLGLRCLFLVYNWGRLNVCFQHERGNEGVVVILIHTETCTKWRLTYKGIFIYACAWVCVCVFSECTLALSADHRVTPQ